MPTPALYTVRTMDPVFNPELVAHRSTRGEGVFAKPRWTELSVYYLWNPPLGGRRWVSVTAGRSDREGEGDRIVQVASATLDDALGYFDPSAPTRAVAQEAHDWLRANAQRLQEAHDARLQAAATPVGAPFTGTTTREALAHLYGVEEPFPHGFIARVARDFGVGESSVRMALKNDTALKVPLAAAAALVDAGKLQDAANG